jgi:hypothetical protein
MYPFAENEERGSRDILETFYGYECHTFQALRPSSTITATSRRKIDSIFVEWVAAKANTKVKFDLYLLHTYLLHSVFWLNRTHLIYQKEEEIRSPGTSGRTTDSGAKRKEIKNILSILGVQGVGKSTGTHTRQHTSFKGDINKCIEFF